jgi:general secretion pathway protein K
MTMTGVGRPRRKRSLKATKQSGVALLQVLLISLVISLLAIRFTQTAQDQIAIAEQFNGRVQAQFTAYSTKSAAIFAVLSDRITPVTVTGPGAGLVLQIKNKLGRHGDPMTFDNGVTIALQDLNGLLPQRYPYHPLWPKVLVGLGLTEQQATQRLGVWSDFQDADIDAWIPGEKEPLTLPTGQAYLNGFAQTDLPLRWVFADQPELTEILLSISDINTPYALNMGNAPRPLLQALFPDISATMINDRGSSEVFVKQLLSTAIVDEFNPPTSVINSSHLQIKTSVTQEQASWTETVTLHLTPFLDPPYRILVAK